MTRLARYLISFDVFSKHCATLRCCILLKCVGQVVFIGLALFIGKRMQMYAYGFVMHKIVKIN